MALDTTRLGQVTAELMETLETDAPPGTEVELGEVMVLAEVKFKDDEGAWTYIAWRCSDDREWVQRGLLHAGLDQERITEDDDGSS